MTNFDPASFVDIESDEPLVRRPPLPVGDYIATIGQVTCSAWQGREDPTKSGLKYTFPLTVEVPPEVQQEMGVELPTLKLSGTIMLDITESGSLDYSIGKNNALRRYREALDMNKPGDKFSARKMEGQIIKVKISHEIYNDQIQERVTSVSKV